MDDLLLGSTPDSTPDSKVVRKINTTCSTPCPGPILEEENKLAAMSNVNEHKLVFPVDHFLRPALVKYNYGLLMSIHRFHGRLPSLFLI
jgi:hypothetical protein